MFDPTLADAYLRFAGRLHPVLVHFPIALIIAAALLEILRHLRRKDEPSPSARSCIILGAIGASAAAFAGWMNADLESHPESVLGVIFWHRWMGVAVAGLAILLAFMSISASFLKHPALQRAYAMLLLGGAAAVGFTAHLGGRLTYGDNYFFEVFNAPGTPGAPESTPSEIVAGAPRPAPAGSVLTVDFARDIQPILNKNCIDCHGPDKQKGRLRLDQPGFLFSPNAKEPILQPGDPAHSDIVERLLMKKGEKGRMPARGEPLPAEQVLLVRTWIAEGAHWGGSAPSEPAPVAPAASPEKPAAATPTPAPVAPVSAWTGDEVGAIDVLRALGGRVEPVAEGAADLDVNLSLGGAKVTDAALAAVARLGPRVRALNVARTPVSDSGVTALAACTKLEKVHLEGTRVTDASLGVLAKLPRLSSLNVSNTGVTDAGIQALGDAKVLKNLYVSDTKVTLDGAIKLQEKLPGVNIEVGIPK